MIKKSTSKQAPVKAKPYTSRLNVSRILELHTAYQETKSLKKAGLTLNPPVTDVRARQMLAKAEKLGIIAGKTFTKTIRNGNVERIMKAYQLYQTYQSTVTCAKFMEPAISAQRVRQLLLAGGEMGLFDNPIKNKQHFLMKIPQEAVQEVYLREKTLKNTAIALHTKIKTLKKYHQLDIVAVKKKSISERKIQHKKKLAEQYFAIAKQIGFMPNVSNLWNTGLGISIPRAWGGMKNFYHDHDIKIQKKKEKQFTTFEERLLVLLACQEKSTPQKLAKKLARHPNGDITLHDSNEKTITTLKKLKERRCLIEIADNTYQIHKR